MKFSSFLYATLVAFLLVELTAAGFNHGQCPCSLQSNDMDDWWTSHDVVHNNMGCPCGYGANEIIYYDESQLSWLDMWCIANSEEGGCTRQHGLPGRILQVKKGCNGPQWMCDSFEAFSHAWNSGTAVIARDFFLLAWIRRFFELLTCAHADTAPDMHASVKICEKEVEYRRILKLWTLIVLSLLTSIIFLVWSGFTDHVINSYFDECICLSHDDEWQEDRDYEQELFVKLNRAHYSISRDKTNGGKNRKSRKDDYESKDGSRNKLNTTPSAILKTSPSSMGAGADRRSQEMKSSPSSMLPGAARSRSGISMNPGVGRQASKVVKPSPSSMNPGLGSKPSKMMKTSPSSMNPGLGSKPSKMIKTSPSSMMKSNPSKMIKSSPSSMNTGLGSNPSKMIKTSPSSMNSGLGSNPSKSIKNSTSSMMKSNPSKMIKPSQSKMKSNPSKMIKPSQSKMKSNPSKMIKPSPSNMVPSPSRMMPSPSRARRKPSRSQWE